MQDKTSKLSTLEELHDAINSGSFTHSQTETLLKVLAWVRHLHDEFDGLECDVEEKGSKNESLRARKDLEQLKADIRDLKKTLAVHSEVTRSGGPITRLRARIEKLEEVFSAADSAAMYAALPRRITDLEAEVKRLASGGRLDLEGATPESHVKAVGEDLDEHDERLTKLEQKVEMIWQSLKRAIDRIDTIATRWDKKTRDTFSGLVANVATIAGRLTNLEDQFKRHLKTKSTKANESPDSASQQGVKVDVPPEGVPVHIIDRNRVNGHLSASEPDSQAREFDKRVEELIADGNSEADAVEAAMKEVHDRCPELGHPVVLSKSESHYSACDERDKLVEFIHDLIVKFSDSLEGDVKSWKHVKSWKRAQAAFVVPVLERLQKDIISGKHLW